MLSVGARLCLISTGRLLRVVVCLTSKTTGCHRGLYVRRHAATTGAARGAHVLF